MQRRYSRIFQVVIVGFVLSAFGCAAGDGGTTGPLVDNGSSNTDPGTTPDVGNNTDPGTTTDTKQEDTTVSLTEAAIACGGNMDSTPGTKIIGSPCTIHEECATGYCYQGWYMGWAGGTGFCTIACSGCNPSSAFCSDFDVEGGPIYTCSKKKHSCLTENFGEEAAEGICIPECVSVADCDSAFGPAYSTCMVPETNECGDSGMGVSKACFTPQP
ncbi:MAG: hypothetical protein CMH54_05350 [Myxococcales bacterium]|nr:hypothetical protein [Myxococcales bacterium]